MLKKALAEIVTWYTVNFYGVKDSSLIMHEEPSPWQFSFLNISWFIPQNNPTKNFKLSTFDIMLSASKSHDHSETKIFSLIGENGFTKSSLQHTS